MSQKTVISSGSAFESQIDYSRAVVTGSWILVSGTTGYDYTTSTLPPTIEAQCSQALLNIQAALVEAGSSMQRCGKGQIHPAGQEDVPKCWSILKEWFGDVKPAATMLQAGLMEESMLIEIEVTARKRGKRVGEDEEAPM